MYRRIPAHRLIAAALLVGFALALIPGIPNLGNQKAGASSIIFASASAVATTTNGNSVTVTKPSDVKSGDVLIAAIAVDQQDPTITAPAGWMSINETIQGTDVSLESFWKAAGGSEAANYTFQDTGAGNTRWAGAIVSYRGVDNSSPIDATGADGAGTGTSSISAPAVTSTVNRARVVGAYAVDNPATRTFTPPTGMTERADGGIDNGGTNAVSMEIADLTKDTAGSSGPNVATASGTGNYAAHQFALKPDGVTRMLLFWDGGAAPTGWSLVTEFDGRFPRGETSANYGLTGGSAGNHTPGVGSVTVNAQITGDFNTGGSGNFNATTAHTHSTTLTPDNTSPASPTSNNNIPSYCNLKLIRNDTGIPNIIPTDAIAIFDDSPGTVPTDWTQLTTRSGKMIRTDSTVSACSTPDGGSDTHTHRLPWQLAAASSGQAERAGCVISCVSVAPTSHTHTAPATTTTATNGTDTCATTGCLPPYIQPLLGQADVDTPTISIGITAMFDGDPGGGWVIRSKATGTSIPSEEIYYQRHLRPANTYDGTQLGSYSHTHANAVSGATSTNSGSGSNTLNLLGNGLAANAHTHTITAVFNSVDATPPYFNVVIAEKVNFTLQAYFWYIDNDANTPAAIWGNPDLAVSNPIITLPVAAADPPDLDRELRLRVQILIGGNNLDAGVIKFKVQYNATRSASCTTLNGTWTDVDASGGSSAWTYAVSNVTPDGVTLLASAFSPASTVLQQYVKSSNPPSFNPNPASIGNTIEYDFHIQHHAADGATQYSFRVIEINGTLLSAYPVCPTLTTKPRTENQLRHGNFFNPDPAGDASGSLENGFSWVD